MDFDEASLNLFTLKELFKKAEDVTFQEFKIHNFQITFIFCNEMIDNQMIFSYILPTLEKFIEHSKGVLKEEELLKLPFPDLQKIEKLETVSFEVFTGKLAIYINELQLLLTCNLAKKPNRSTEETKMELLIKGPRDNFIENISTNIALIRKRLPTHSLCVEKLTIGERSKTTVAILYLQDIANEQIIAEVKKQLENIDTDIILNGDSLMEQFQGKKLLMPWTNETGRPDFAIQSLIRGRLVILVDGVSYAIITPVNFTYLLKTGEDYEYPLLFSAFERTMRFAGVMVGILLPAFWLALITFHPNQLPSQLLATVVVSSRGLPFPTALEMIVLLLMFEMFREAGMRLPTAIGSTISVVGGLIIGDAAIRAGITSPAMLVIIALSFIATFTVSNQSLLTLITIIRFIFIIVTSFFGLFGFFLCIYLLLLYMANIRIFGVPYLNFSAELNWSTFGKSMARLTNRQYRERPKMLSPTDKTRTSDEGQK
ncbi:spore germination protein [Ureibacillus sp. FSL K6-2830]|uniref:spore germination protein n=1 Tax=Ureibacillus sp. FSL K6-2830 TaxID=2954610 RepID=UPI0030F4DD12